MYVLSHTVRLYYFAIALSSFLLFAYNVISKRGGAGIEKVVVYHRDWTACGRLWNTSVHVSARLVSHLYSVGASYSCGFSHSLLKINGLL